MPEIQTATGALDTTRMGFTLTHEHVIVRWPPMHLEYAHDFDRQAVLTIAVSRLRSAYEAGVRTLVDMTPPDLGRHAEMLREASEQSGIHVVVATGFYWQIPMGFRYRPTADIRDFMVREIDDGIGLTGIRAGVIKCASEHEVDRMNERVLRASAQAQATTGVPIGTHSSPLHRTGLDQARILVDAGANPHQVIIGHCDDASDLEYLEAIIETGCSVGFDRFGITTPNTTEDRIRLIAGLIDRGHVHRIVLSHDASAYIETVTDELRDRMPDWRYEYIPTAVLPLMRERGITDAEIDQMVRTNPQRIFSGS